jgi:autophagy-related protein 11
LKEQDSFRLSNRDHLVARITKIDERIVDLTKAMGSSRASHLAADGRSITESEGGMSFEDDNPFDLSDGLRWYLLEAQEEKVGAPSTPGLGKATVSAANVDARGSIRISSSKKKSSDAIEEASKALGRSLDSRRSSQSSKKNLPVGLGIGKTGSNEALRVDPPDTGRTPGPGPSHLRTTSDAESMLPVDSGEPATVQANTLDEVRRNLLWGP